jgi:3-deoxy-D-manno-octulosonic-acid transferase
MKKAIPGLSFKIALDILYALSLPTVLGFYIIRAKYHLGWLERILLGRWRYIIKDNSDIVWIHAVSLGEAREAVFLYRRLKEERPDYRYLLTTVTDTGGKFLRRHVDKDDYSAYMPLDFSFFMRRILNLLQVKLALILETELWPNFIIALKERGIALGLINARISKKSFPRYKLIKNQIARILNQLDFVSSSGAITTSRLKYLGLDNNSNYIYEGNIKFDLTVPLVKKDSRIDDLGYILKNKGYKLFIAGSTHGEESMLLSQSFLKLSSSNPDWRFLLAPRQLRESESLKGFLKDRGYGFNLFSAGFKQELKNNIYIIDEVGYLPALYGLSDAVFVGGSLLPYGGHNIIEPAIFKKPILIGPYYHNFKEIVDQFLKEDAVLLVDKDSILLCMEKVFKDQSLREDYGQRAFKVLERNRGGLEIIADFIFRKYI